MNFCPKCGAPVQGNSAFCANCGMQLPNPGNPAQNPVQQPQNVYPNNGANYGPAADGQPPVYRQQPVYQPPVQQQPVYQPPVYHQPVGGAVRTAAAVGVKTASAGKKIVIWVLVLALLSGGTIGILAALGVFKSDEQKIRDTLSDFQDCYNSGDLEGLEECFCRSMRTKLSAITGLMGAGLSGLTGIGLDMSDLFGLAGGMATLDLQIDNIQIEGDRAVVTGTMTSATAAIAGLYGGGSQDLPFCMTMVKEGGDWLIENFTDSVN